MILVKVVIAKQNYVQIDITWRGEQTGTDFVVESNM